MVYWSSEIYSTSRLSSSTAGASGLLYKTAKFSFEAPKRELLLYHEMTMTSADRTPEISDAEFSKVISKPLIKVHVQGESLAKICCDCSATTSAHNDK